MMEMGFIITISLRLMIAVELRVASKIGKLANFSVKHVILPAQNFVHGFLAAYVCGRMHMKKTSTWLKYKNVCPGLSCTFLFQTRLSLHQLLMLSLHQLLIEDKFSLEI